MTLGFADFFTFFLIGSMLYIGFLWLREIRRLGRNEWQLSRSQLFHCNNCHLSFVPKEPVSLCRCPRCNTLCIRRSNAVNQQQQSPGNREERS